MPNLREVSREDAEKIWAGQCPVCGGKLVGARSKSKGPMNMMCEYGCQKFNVQPRPALPQRI
jgi:hypothetical protein